MKKTILLRSSNGAVLFSQGLGNAPLRLFAVHVVDQGKPLYDHSN